MATENLFGACITNRDAVPSVINDGRLERGVLKEACDTVATTSGKTVGSTYRLNSVPSSARVSQVLLTAAAMTVGAFDIGVYRNTKDGGAVVSAALFGSAVDCSAAVVDVDVTGESATYTAAKRQQPLWQAAGLTSDPGGTLDIVATSTNTITAGAAIMLRTRYCDNGA
jgi:hypothetical protein